MHSPIAGRYDVTAVLGQGGTSIVYDARDRQTDRRVALKRLRVPAGSASTAKFFSMFEREYLTLVQLTHPSIVQVYDYGIDEGGPYYTMELVDAGDLQALAPIPWRPACVIARDVCSVLALLHSRRVVYRDLSPRNVRRTQTGVTKLIDFGAMTPMGPTRDLVGTFPFMAPEAVNQQDLDGRTDLYSLGATLYFTLVARLAYPARDIAQLREVWRVRPRRPSEIDPSIPAALDDLVMDLLQLEPSLRPTNASEVIERLGAIAGLRSSEQVQVSEAYLANPTIVGRGEQLEHARALVKSTLQGKGCATLLRGAAGSGRSRLLGAYVLEAKLAGLTVARADPSDAQAGDYGAIRALVGQLFELGPLVAEAAEGAVPLLGHVIPELLAKHPNVALEASVHSDQRGARIQQALRHWLLRVADQRPLMLAVDDVARIDDASAACLALLAQEVAGHRLALAMTIADDDSSATSPRAALSLLASSSVAEVVHPLMLAQTEELLRSVFGDAPNLAALARYVHEVSGGNPRDIMRLTEYLVSEQIVHYQAGMWSLPVRFEARGLPASMGDALRMRVARLSRDALGLALAFALEPAQAFAFDECVGLALTPSDIGHAHLLELLDELVAADVVRYVGSRYGLRQVGWVASIEAAAAPLQITASHARLAAVFGARGDEVRVAQHLLKAGELERGLDVLREHAVASEARTDRDARVFYEVLGSLPADWLRIYELGLRLCQELGRPAKQRDELLSRLAGLVAFAAADTDGYAHIEARIGRLYQECGLADFAALPSTLDFGTRLKRALEAAGGRFAGTPAHDRVGDPGWAIKEIAKTTLAALGTTMSTQDYVACARLPSLAPLIPLSPAVDVVHRLTKGLCSRLIGRTGEAYAIYESLLARMAEPDRAGLTEVHHLTTRLRIVQGLGMLDAAMGRAACLERAKEIESEPLFAIQAMFLRHIYLVWQGRLDEADRYKQQIEIARIENNVRYGFEGQHLLSELVAYALCDDLTRLKRATDAIEPRARVHRAWVPVLTFGRAEYHRIRGDYEAALSEHERGLALMPLGDNQIWIYAASAHLRTLNALGRYAEACVVGHAAMRVAEANGIDSVHNYLRMVLSIALSGAGEHAQAAALAESAVVALTEQSCAGLFLAAAYDTSARVAYASGDREGCGRYAALCVEQLSGEARALVEAKFRRLMQPAQAPRPSTKDAFSLATLAPMLARCADTGARAQAGLAFLGGQSGAVGGVLYVHSDAGLVRAASWGDAALADDDRASAYFASELEASDDTAAFSSRPPPVTARESSPASGPRVVHVLLSHESGRDVGITGLAALVLEDPSTFVYPTRAAAVLSAALAAGTDIATVHQ